MTLQLVPAAIFFLQVTGMTEGRSATILPGTLGLLALIIGWLALVRSGKYTRIPRLMAAVALATAVSGVLLSILHLIRATGAIGTGSGRLGAIVALVLCLVGLVLGILAWARAARTAARKQINVSKQV